MIPYSDLVRIHRGGFRGSYTDSDHHLGSVLRKWALFLLFVLCPQPVQFLSGSVSLGIVQTISPSIAPPGVASSAVSYLLDNYNSAVGLIRNSPDSPSLSNTYYLYSDNFLVALALQYGGAVNYTMAKVSSNITNSIRLYVHAQPNQVNQYETLTTFASPFNASKDITLKTIGLGTINTTVNNQSPTWLDLHHFADIAFLEAIYYYETGNYSASTFTFQAGVAAYDGTGFNDSAFIGQYQTYKLALYIYASRLLGFSSDPTVFDNLIAMQSDNGVDKGGFYTCYDSQIEARCGTNTETTALALLALSVPNTTTGIASGLQPIVLDYSVVALVVTVSLATVLIVWRRRSNGTNDSG